QQGYPQQGYPQQGVQQSAYLNPQQAAPYQQNGGIVSQPLHSGMMQQRSIYQQPQGGQSVMVSQNLASNGGTYKNRLASFMDDEAAAAADEAEEAETGLSKDEMLKKAKERKKVAKNNFGFKKNGL
ncbi:MAG TPA: hypothetical protein DCG49_08035, partial [Ruminococcus sp.]|nr:hypothetical protein [Ruminococcus sp.]